MRTFKLSTDIQDIPAGTIVEVNVFQLGPLCPPVRSQTFIDGQAVERESLEQELPFPFNSYRIGGKQLEGELLEEVKKQDPELQ